MGEIKRDAEKTKSGLQEAGEDLLAYIQFAESESRKIHQSGEQDPQKRTYPHQVIPGVLKFILQFKKIQRDKKILDKIEQALYF